MEMEESVLGVVFLLFGMTWLMVGATPAITCVYEYPGGTCAVQSSTAFVWTLAGIASMGAGVLFLGLRLTSKKNN
jgi:hypothetical protein